MYTIFFGVENAPSFSRKFKKIKKAAVEFKRFSMSKN